MDIMSHYIELSNTINVLIEQRKTAVIQIIKDRFKSKFNSVTNITSVSVGDLNEVVSEDTIQNLKQNIMDVVNDYLQKDLTDRNVYAIDFDINGYMVFYTYNTKGNPHAKS